MGTGTSDALRCATHPALVADASCARCGTKACVQCIARTSCKACLRSFLEAQRTRITMIRGLGLLYVGTAAWAAAMVGTMLSEPFEMVLAVSAMTAPLILTGLGLYRFDPRARFIGIIVSWTAIAVLDGPGIIVVAAALYALLPKVTREILSPLSREASEAHPDIGRWWKPWIPYAVFVPLLGVYGALEYVPPGERASLAQRPSR